MAGFSLASKNVRPVLSDPRQLVANPHPTPAPGAQSPTPARIIVGGSNYRRADDQRRPPPTPPAVAPTPTASPPEDFVDLG
jgi:hypothetical protein